MSTIGEHRTDRVRNRRSNIALATLIAGTLIGVGWPVAPAAADDCEPTDTSCVAESTPPTEPAPGGETTTEPAPGDQTTEPSDPPTTEPSDPPTTEPSDPPTTAPSDPPTTEPSDPPTTEPSDPPTTEPSDPPTTEPSDPPNTAPPTTAPPTTAPPTTAPPTTAPPTTAPVVPPSPKPPAPVPVLKATGKPTISGTLTVGKALKVKTSAVRWNASSVKVSYRWLVDGKSRSTKTTYTLQPKDAGLKVVLEVTAKKAGYTSGLVKSATKTVAKLDSKTSLELGLVRAKVATYATVNVKVAKLAPTGTVSVLVNGKVKGKAKLTAASKGKVKIRVPGLPAGKVRIVASYAGSDQVKTSTSDGFQLTLS